MIAKLLLTLATLYHVMATVAAMMAVFHFIRIFRGDESRHPVWRHVFRWGETHLWISGFALIGMGVFITGLEKYLNNPKLWTKVSLVLIWGLNSIWIKHTLRSASPAQRNLMLGVSMASLFYGTFLGVAKPLAYGVLPFPWFIAGFAATIAACTYAASRLFADMPMHGTAR